MKLFFRFFFVLNCFSFFSSCAMMKSFISRFYISWFWLKFNYISICRCNMWCSSESHSIGMLQTLFKLQTNRQTGRHTTLLEELCFSNTNHLFIQTTIKFEIFQWIYVWFFFWFCSDWKLIWFEVELEWNESKVLLFCVMTWK